MGDGGGSFPEPAGMKIKQIPPSAAPIRDVLAN
jgi:hypothetical protein